MFTTEKTIHIAVEILVVIALYFFLTSRAARDKQMLEARIEQLDERLEFLEALIGGAGRAMPQQPQAAFVFHAPPQTRVGDAQELEVFEPEHKWESERKGYHVTENEVEAEATKVEKMVWDKIKAEEKEALEVEQQLMETLEPLVEQQAEKEDEIVWDETLLELEEE